MIFDIWPTDSLYGPEKNLQIFWPNYFEIGSQNSHHKCTVFSLMKGLSDRESCHFGYFKGAIKITITYKKACIL